MSTTNPITTKNQTSGQRGLHSQSLDLMRFPLAVVVLTVHVSVIKLTGPENAHVAKAFWKVVEVFLHDQSVPIYFFIAGYVFFLNNGMTLPEYKRKLHNRIKSLFIPYIIWNALMIMRVWLKSVFVDGEPFVPTPGNLLSCFWIYNGGLEDRVVTSPYPINLPLWFLRDLMIVVLASPAIYWILRKTGKVTVYILGALWLARWIIPSNHAVQIVTALFFFSWGGYMSIFKKDMIKQFGRLSIASAVAYPLLGITCWWAFTNMPQAYVHIKDLYVITGLCVSYNLAAWLLRKGYCKVSPLLANSSYFVYISHYLVCYYIARGVFLLLNPGSALMVIMCYLITIAVTVSILIGIFWLMRNYTPGLMRIVAGRK